MANLTTAANAACSTAFGAAVQNAFAQLENRLIAAQSDQDRSDSIASFEAALKFAGDAFNISQTSVPKVFGA